MQNFIDIVLPPLLLLAGVAAVAGACLVLTVARLRLWSARRRRITGLRPALTSAADALATALAEPALSSNAREIVLSAYAQVTAAVAAEKEGSK